MAWHLIGSNDGTAQLKEAGNDPVPRMSIHAYNGGKVELGLKYPVIFNLATLKSSPNVPLLKDHKPDVVIGHNIQLAIGPNNIISLAALSGANAARDEVVNAGKNGYPWQTSIGVISNRLDLIKQGEKLQLNGRSFDGPFYVAEEATLKEISVLALGADDTTLAVLQASYLKGVVMTFAEWLQAVCTVLNLEAASLTPEQSGAMQTIYAEAYGENGDAVPTEPVAVAARERGTKVLKAMIAKRTTPGNPSPTPLPTPGNTGGGNGGNGVGDVITQFRAEQTRVAKINELNAKYKEPKNKEGQSILLMAVEGGWTLEKTELEMLKCARPDTLLIGSNVNAGDRMNFHRLLEAGIVLTGKLDEKLLVKKYGEQTLEAADKKYRSITLQQILLECAIHNGYTGSFNVKANLRQVLQAAFSTHDISEILSNTTNLQLMAGYSAVDQSWREIANITRADDFKEFSSYRATGGFTFEKIGAAGMIPHGSMTEAGFANKVDTYAKMFAITRQDIINDSLGALNDVPRQLGRGGATGLVRAFWVEFMNNSTFFAAGNLNVSTGALSVAGLNAALAVFRKLKGSDGEYLMHEPKLLLTPTELAITADSLFTDTQLAYTLTGTQTANNPHRGKFRPVTSPYLSDSTITGNSATAYYLLADPNDVPVIQVAFLDGKQVPTVETADTDFNTLGIQMRGFWDWGVRKQDPDGGVRSTGV